MTEDTDQDIERLLDCKGLLTTIKSHISSLCVFMYERLELEMCLFILYGPNRFLSPFIISYPSSDYEKLTEDKIASLEAELNNNKDLEVIPLQINRFKFGSIVLYKSQDTKNERLLQFKMIINSLLLNDWTHFPVILLGNIFGVIQLLILADKTESMKVDFQSSRKEIYPGKGNGTRQDD